MCGIFGIANYPDAATQTYLGLYALQHRGQESTGISSSDGDQVYTHKSMGYVADVFSEDVLAHLIGEPIPGDPDWAGGTVFRFTVRRAAEGESAD